MKHEIILTAIIIFSCMVSCDEAESPTVIQQDPSIEEMEAIVRGNCDILKDALESFASENNGIYPLNSCSDTTEAGENLIDFLPNGERLLNPFTGERDLPVDTIASNPGEVGYLPYGYAGITPVYRISGFGADSIIVRIDNFEELESVVVMNCYVLMDAVERYSAENDGTYPYSLSSTNLEGKTVVGYLPEGQLMMNPFTKAQTEPIIGAAAQPGEIGYLVSYDQGEVCGYVITGGGRYADLIIILCRGPEC